MLNLHRNVIVVIVLFQLHGTVVAENRDLTAFLQSACIDCHSGTEAEAGLDLTVVDLGMESPSALQRGVRIHDRVQNGEMPPADAEQPTAAERERFLVRLAGDLTRAHAQEKKSALRRLNRGEYENTLNDLFGTHLDLSSLFPEDGRSHEFDNVGEALSVSAVHMQRYVDAAGLVWNAAMAKDVKPPGRNIVRASFADTREADRFLGKNWHKLDDGAVVFYRQWGYPTGMLREANARQSGHYKVRVTGYAHQSDVPVTFSIGAVTFQRGVEQPIFGFYELPPGEPATVEIDAWIEERYMIAIEPWGISDDFEIKQVGIENYTGPGLAIQHVEVEGPLTDKFPSRGHRLVLDGLDRREIEPPNPSIKQKSWYKPEFEIVSPNPVEDVRPVLVRVASAAFRRPVSEAEIEPYFSLFQSELKLEATIEEALKTAVTAILCAPDFLFLREAPGALDDHALASRLSYFLIRTFPDGDLRDAADSQSLTADDGELRRQVERLLEHPHASRFVDDFTDAWLDLRNMDFTSPDRNLFPEFDAFLQHSMVAETRAFFRELIDDNLRVGNIVKSDFAMLNSRLADHYGINGVGGPQVRRVALSSDSVRGGFLTQGSVLKVSANGTNTSPVVRGVWVMERILGEVPPPPPPGISGVEPDIRGAKTLREILDQHRDVDTCRNCHAMIDPPGFALESFDPIGGWRDRFRSLGEGDRVELEIDGRRVRYKLGPLVDASGSLPDERTFSGYTEFRDHLSADEERLARAFFHKLLTFATGRELGFSDRPEIARLVKESAERGHGVRDMIILVTTSEIFRRK